MLALLLPVVVFGTLVFLALALMAPAEDVIQARLRAYGYTMPARDLSAPLAQRLLLPLVEQIARLVRRFSPRLVESDLRQRLAQAGHPTGLDVSTFLALKAVGAVGLFLLIGGLSLLRGPLDLRTVLLALGALAVGWWLPEGWLRRRIRQRTQAIERALPDALDLIVVCIEAGHALEAALATVTQRFRGPLGEEFERTLREIALGKTRREALRDLSRRVGSADLQAFIAAILQADQLGVSIAQVLRVQADAMRVRRRQRAEEQAAKLPVKMLFPLIFLVFPALLIVILGPAALRIMEFFAAYRGGG